MDAWDLIKRLRKLARVLQEMDWDEYRQVMVWLKNVLTPKIPGAAREQLSRILDETNPWEVEKMITNLEIALDEMQQQALLKGKIEGKIEGKMEVARNLLLLKVDIGTISRATGLTVEEIEALRNQLQ